MDRYPLRRARPVAAITTIDPNLDGHLMELFDNLKGASDAAGPLADRMRPRALSEVVGQHHLLGEGKLLSRVVREDRVPSLIMWGPPGSGKTTIAMVIANSTGAFFAPFSAVLGGVKEIRQIVSEAKDRTTLHGERTILFVDEIHRFNKAQQDAFLPHVERGTVVLIGATTENPSFTVNAALLSRCRVLQLHRLTQADLEVLVKRALKDDQQGLGEMAIELEEEVAAAIAASADGDGRRALTTVEIAAELASSDGRSTICVGDVEQAVGRKNLLYDRQGDEHYNLASAFIKSMRGSDPDAALYWMMRMLEAGEDPLFIMRRMLIFASEDIGNADPRALQIATAADYAVQRLGMPEARYALTQTVTYLSVAAKSNATVRAQSAAKQDIDELGTLPVPLKLCNAATKLMKSMGYGKGYRYPHDYPGGWVSETYLPEALEGRVYYEPVDRGLERQIGKRLDEIRGSKGAGQPDKRDTGTKKSKP